ncbi:unnamed protein product [Natator depressus]
MYTYEQTSVEATSNTPALEGRERRHHCYFPISPPFLLPFCLSFLLAAGERQAADRLHHFLHRLQQQRGEREQVESSETAVKLPSRHGGSVPLRKQKIPKLPPLPAPVCWAAAARPRSRREAARGQMVLQPFL